MSLSSGLIALVALAYMAVLFAIAFYGDRRKGPMSPRVRAWVYSLSLAVYCTSWTFFGSVGQAAEQLWAFLPIYLGPVLLLLFGPQIIQKMLLISKQENITSIADFIAARYGKSQLLAIVVTLISSIRYFIESLSPVPCCALSSQVQPISAAGNVGRKSP